MTRHRTVPLLGALLLLSTTSAAQRPVVTVAANGIVRVSQHLPLDLPGGRSQHRVDLGDAIAVSLVSSTPGVRVVEVRRDLVLDEAALLRRSVGREFDLVTAEGAALRRRLLGIEPERWSHPSGSIDLARPGRILWPDSLVKPNVGLLLTLESDRQRSGIDVEYEVSGGAWAVVYDLRLGEPGTLSGNALMATGALRLDTATTRLIAGDLGSRAQSLPRLKIEYRDFSGSGVQGALAALNPRDMVSRAADRENTYVTGVPVVPGTLSGQVYQYQLPEPVVFQPGRELAVPLFEHVLVEPVQRLTIGGAVPPRGEVERDPAERRVAVNLSYDIERPRGTTLGDLPLPAGIVSVFQPGVDGIGQLLGRTMIGHIAPGMTMQVNLGASFDVTATRAQTSWQVDARDDQGRAIGALVGYRLSVRNAGDTAVTATAYESRLGDWQLVDSSIPAERRDNGALAFAVQVPARGEAVLTYRLRLSW